MEIREISGFSRSVRKSTWHVYNHCQEKRFFLMDPRMFELFCLSKFLSKRPVSKSIDHAYNHVTNLTYLVVANISLVGIHKSSRNISICAL
jgi:hypothetical protein